MSLGLEGFLYFTVGFVAKTLNPVRVEELGLTKPRTWYV